jgi:hypothetical protein
LKITQVALKFISTIFLCKSCAKFLTKNGFGYILVDFFTNSSGHPVPRRQFLVELFFLWHELVGLETFTPTDNKPTLTATRD